MNGQQPYISVVEPLTPAIERVKTILFRPFDLGKWFVIGFCACVTCCCAACILAIPYIGTVLYLPVLVFHRSYTLYYLRQYGPAFDIFGVAEPVPTPE